MGWRLAGAVPGSDFGFRASFGLRISVFGFHVRPPPSTFTLPCSKATRQVAPKLFQSPEGGGFAGWTGLLVSHPCALRLRFHLDDGVCHIFCIVWFAYGGRGQVQPVQCPLDGRARNRQPRAWETCHQARQIKAFVEVFDG